MRFCQAHINTTNTQEQSELTLHALLLLCQQRAGEKGENEREMKRGKAVHSGEIPEQLSSLQPNTEPPFLSLYLSHTHSFIQNTPLTHDDGDSPE